MAATTQKIIVSIVDAHGNSIEPKPLAFKPPQARDVIVQEMLDGGHGVGHLLDEQGYTVTRGSNVPAGNYKYRVTGAGGAAGVSGNMCGSNQDQVLQQVMNMMVTVQQETLNTLRTIQQSVVPEQIAASTVDSGKANLALACCGIQVLGILSDVPCCYDKLLPTGLDSIMSMTWLPGKREDAHENMRMAQDVLTTWVRDAELHVLDVHGCFFLSFSASRVQLAGSATDLVIVDTTLAARYLDPSALGQLLEGKGTVLILQAVAKAIYAAYECKTTNTARGRLREFVPQCKVQFAALNIMASVYGGGQDSLACAETTVWCGDLNPGLTMGLHSRLHMDLGDQRYPRVLHVMMPKVECPPEEAAKMLSAFRRSLQDTKEVRRSLWGTASVPAAGPAPNSRQHSGPGDMDAETAPSQGGPVAGTAYSRTAGAPPPPQQGPAGSSSLQPQVDRAIDEVDDLPVDYHERIEYNLAVQDALLATFDKPSQLQGLGLTEPELRAQVASLDACGWLSAVGRKLAIVLQERRAADAGDVQCADQGA